jgi:hypothetical protein
LLIATVRRLRALKLYAVLLAIVALIGATTVVAVVVICRSRVWGSRCLVLVVAVVRLSGVVSWSSGPAGTVEGRAAGLAPAASSDAAVSCELWVHSRLEVYPGCGDPESFVGMDLPA